MLLAKEIETSVCIFEKENRLGGKIYDHFFPQAPDIPVGQFSVEKQKQKICMCVLGMGKVSNVFARSKTTGKAGVMIVFFDCCFCFVSTRTM